MPPLRRHQLAYLSASGWREVLEAEGIDFQGASREAPSLSASPRPGSGRGAGVRAAERERGAWRLGVQEPQDEQAVSCFLHWAEHKLPLVVTRQPLPADGADPLITLGLSAPPAWGRRLLSLQVPPQAIGWFGEFPELAETLAQLPRSARPVLQVLADGLAAQGLRAHAYGSSGWQRITGQRYLHARSDLDLWLPVDGADVADAAVALLQRHVPAHLRIDGELVFPDGAAVAWREWDAWRAGRSRAVLVKRLHGVSMEQALPGVSAPLPWACAA
ncbi:malonate decarboxylase holo-[acyl-carrier-protein] synthase [Azohydromonas caseinilytica]|uniref:Malonate decarboxylase holo-[acyl-carrier-protein] synthase n=1 Tax=Azohydromonas caseinilytica TaxID=2728836 RepID=A0A848FAB9_9BURK|nr:malonate decarboxylase holo-[acyl-carrier-protein] synthase [Azohydromonas caseinilytica]NML16484.1 malonate decarboxylase holo-[acyl-carrier-protein] synthase [Azohydromonas caseinilytica]